MTIVEKVLEEYQNDRDLLRNHDWVLITLYNYMSCPIEPKAEIRQDCIWTARRLVPEVSDWGITQDQYNEACARWRQIRRNLS